MSNHYHLLVIPDSEQQLASFMRFVNTNLSKQLGRLHDWSGSMFQRYKAIPVSDEEEAQVGRLRYILRHGVKEGLVSRPADWPGVQCVAALTRGPARFHGVWHERTAIYEAEQRGQSLPAKKRISQETLDFSSLPVWAAKDGGQCREAARAMVVEIEKQASEARATGGSKPMGDRAILAQDPHHRPQSLKRSAAPIAHAATVEIWLVMKTAYREFLFAYREAAECLKAGLDAAFPTGCFPPAAPHVPRAGPA